MALSLTDTVFDPAPASRLSLWRQRWAKALPAALLVLAGAAIPAAAWAALGTSVTLYPGDPANIYPGETTRLQITLSNSNTASAINSVAFSTNLPGTWPNGLRIAGPVDPVDGYTCYDPADGSTSTGAGTLTADTGAQAISLSGGVIPARANNTDGYCTISFPVTAGFYSTSGTTYTYNIAGGAVTGNDGGAVANSGAVSQSVNLLAFARPTISKSFGTATLYLGGNATTLTITLTNTNSAPITNFTVTDMFPQLGGAGIIQVAAAPTASASCNNGGTAPTFTPSAGDTTITATGTLPAKAGSTNGVCTLSVQVEGAQTNGAYTTNAQSNVINASSQFTNDIQVAAAANASANITVRSPLRVTKTVGHAYLASGKSDNFYITLYNDSNAALTVTGLTDDPIDGVGNAGYGLKVGAAGPTVSCTGAGTAGTFAATAGDTGVTQTADTTIAAGGSCTVTIPFDATVQTAGTPRTYTNSLALGAVITATPGIVSQNASAAITVSDDLRVTKSVSPGSVVPGNPIRYAVTVENYGAGAITDVTITDTLTNGQSFLTGTINGLNFTPALSGAGCSGLTVTGATGDTAPQFTIGTLPGRSADYSPGSCTVTFYAMTATAGTAPGNTVGAGAVCYTDGASVVHCNGGASNSVSATVTANPLTAAKSYNRVSPQSEGTIVRTTITLTNASANGLSVSVADNLPIAVGGGQMRVATPANAATTCGGSPVITAVANSTSVAMNGATVPGRASNGTGSNGSCVLQFDVVAAAGTYTNSATITGTETYANGSTHTVNATATASAFTFSSALSATTSFNPASVSSGGKSTVTVRLANSGAVALTGVGITDPLPGGMVLASPPNAYTTCSGSPSVTAVAGAGSVGLSGAALAGGGSCDLLYDVIATGSANWVHTIPAGNITADGGVTNQSAVSATLTYSAPINLTVAKTTNPSTLTFPGQVSELTITLTAGSQALTNLRLTDHFTADGSGGAAANGMVIAATPAASTTCPGGIVSAGAGGTSVSLSGVSLGASDSCTLSVNVTSTAVGGITNYIPIGAIATDQGLTNNGAATTSLTTQSNIGVTKQFTPNVVAPGERSRLRITFYNPTSLPMSSVAVIDTLPAGLTVPSGPSATTTCSGATVSSPAADRVQVAGGTIAAASGGVAASCYAEIDVVGAAQGDYVNTIAAGSVTGSSGGSSVTNSQPASDTLRVKSPLTAHMAIASYTLDAGNPVGFTTGSASRSPGSPATLTVRLDNPNGTALTAAAFTNNLPTGLVVGTTPNAATTCAGGTVIAAASATTIRLSGATVPAGGSCTVTVDLLSNISGTYTNSLAAGNVTTFEGVTNGEPTSARLLVSTPPTVAKQFSPAVIPTGGTSTLTIVLGNDNTSAVTLTSALVDTLPTAPGNIVVAAIPAVSKTCPGTVTATAGAGTITYANGSQIPAGGCTISVNVTGSTAGTHTNNIPAGALTTNLGNNQQPANATLTVSSLGHFSGKVFKDNNVTPDGIYQSGTDTPIAGVSIELHSGAGCGGALVESTTTDSLGNYLFSGLAAGTYSVCEPVQPTGTVNGITSAGVLVSANGSTGTVGTASNLTATTSQVVGIVLNGDGAGGDISGYSGINFAEVVQSSISGTVFVDQNNNGVQNGADTGIAGVTIELLDGSNAVIATTTTDAGGDYSFTALDPGTWSVRQPSQPSGSSNGITTAGSVANGGSAGTATTVTVSPSGISGIVLPPNTATTGNNFAEIPNGRTISGRVFLDYGSDGGFDGGSDNGLGSQTINVTGTDINGNGVSTSGTTGSDGTFTVTGLPAGTYTLDQGTQPTGTTNGATTAGSAGGTASNPTATSSRIANIDLTTTTVAADNTFAEIPGNVPDLAVAKTHSPASFGEGSSTGYYTITPRNIGLAATSGAITLVDTLPAGITATAASGTGWICGIAAQVVTCTSSNVIAAGDSGNAITLHAAVAAGLAGQVLTNIAVISGGGEPPGFDGNNTATDPTPISTTAAASGHVWRDLDHDRVLDAGETLVSGWNVELLFGGTVVASDTTDTNGVYAFPGVAPGAGYEIRFRDPVSGAIYGRPLPNESGNAYTNGVVSAENPAGADNSDGTLSGMTLVAGDNIVEQSLPLDPSGVVYDAVTRAPIAGAAVSITGPVGFDAATHLVGGAANQSQTTDATGFYQFLLLGGAPAGDYILTVTAPGGYLDGPSVMLPPQTGPLAVGALPDPNLISADNSPPAAGTAAVYYLSFTLSAASANVLNNHIPLDPVLGGAIVMTKISPKRTVSRGELVPYTLTARNTLASSLPNIAVIDQVPAGFKYVKGSATLGGVKTEPAVAGRVLAWNALSFAAGETKQLQLLLVVGAGVNDGDYVNQTWAMNTTADARVSNTASATVRVVPDPTFECSDLIGKVFDDRNLNGYQDKGEPGLPGVRIASAKGWLVTTDAQGRYHVACAQVPDELKGSNFILKLDERTLPSGYRVTTENPRVVRLTQGKLAKLNFGAAIHRVVRLDVDSRAFDDKGALSAAYAARMEEVLKLLHESPSVLRLAYHLSAGEGESTARERLTLLHQTIEKRWTPNGCCYDLLIEDEVVSQNGNEEAAQ